MISGVSQHMCRNHTSGPFTTDNPPAVTDTSQIRPVTAVNIALLAGKWDPLYFTLLLPNLSDFAFNFCDTNLLQYK